MKTKEQEREAVNQIEKILSGMDSDSYVTAAFDGCCDLARRNIDCDFLESWKGQVDCAEKEIDRLQNQLQEKKCRIADLRQQVICLQEKLQAAAEKPAAPDPAAAEKDLLILQLKAKLYDLTVAG